MQLNNKQMQNNQEFGIKGVAQNGLIVRTVILNRYKITIFNKTKVPTVDLTNP